MRIVGDDIRAIDQARKFIEGLIDEVHVKITILVCIKESGLDAKTNIIYAILCSLFAKQVFTLVDVEFIPVVIRTTPVGEFLHT